MPFSISRRVTALDVEMTGPAANENQTETSQGVVDGFGNGSMIVSPKLISTLKFCHPPILPQGVTAISVAPKIEFVAIVLCEQ